ncbi:unnamed protein product [Urochloa decumbens]|uniref:Uncharacterized protein n=1 Tax=Urochloa decumbens TaxID=240449 RepID=A0ABC9GQI4_9POAL
MEAAFDACFRAADLDRDGQISCQEAVAFFKGSGLPQPVLAQIWTYADKNRTGFLGREDFYNSLKLVTVAQSGRELTPDIVKSELFGPAAAKIPAPRINVSTAAPQTNSVASPLNATQTLGSGQQNPAVRVPQVPPGASSNPQVNTHLPPRKRLLAGLRTAATSCDATEPLPSSLASGDLIARLREMALAANASGSSPEEMIEAARVAAEAAAASAVAACAAAAEKAAVAAKARAAARAAMEFLDSFSMTGTSRNGLQFKVKSRKKHVQVKTLYRPNGSLGDAPKPRRRKQSDEEIARNLHRAMNSSPRISNTGPPKRPRGTASNGKDRAAPGEGGGDACNGSTHAPVEAGSGLPNGCSEGKSSETTVPMFKHEGPHNGGDNPSRHAAKSSGDVTDNGVGTGNLSAARKVMIKRKELVLNQHNNKETEPSVQPIGQDESKANGNETEKHGSPADAKAPGDGVVPMKITSVWKFKKLKTSHCSSDSKVLHNVCSSPTAAETSASVKAD